VSSASINATDVEIAASRLQVVSCKTAFACLDRVRGADGKRMTAAAMGLVDDADDSVLPLDRLIAGAKKGGLRLRSTSFNWRGLLIATASKTILLLLKNGNVVVVIGTGREGVEEIVVSDPLYQDGEPFFLPRLALEHAWGGEALIVKPNRSKGERALAWYFSILSVLGLAAGVLLLSEAAIDVTVAGSHSPPSENTLGSSAGDAAGGFVSNNDQTAAVFAAGETPKPVNAAPGSDRATQAIDIRTGGNSPGDIAAVSAGEFRNPEPGASDGSKASTPIPSEPAAQQMAARIDDNSKTIPEPLAGETPLGVSPPARVSAAPARNPESKASPSGLSGVEVQALLARGDALVAKGDIASARLFYERAAEAGDGQAALRLGESYDPAFLAQAHLSGVRGDAVAAAHWYQRARELGITEAETLLQTILPEKDQRRP
jgi:hypothetical protein